MQRPPSTEEQAGKAIGDSPLHRLRQGALDAIHELNTQLVDLLCEKAVSETEHFPLATEVRRRLTLLPTEQRAEIARSGILLIDLGFSDPGRWLAALDGSGIPTKAADTATLWSTPEESLALAKSTLLVAWYILQANRALAGVLLGMSEEVVTLFADRGLNALARVAGQHSEWLRPRWEGNPEAWLGLLDHPQQVAYEASAYATLRCLQLSGGEAPWLSAYLDTPR